MCIRDSTWSLNMYGIRLGGWTTGVTLASIFISYSPARLPIPLNWLRYLLSISGWGSPSPLHPTVNSLFTKFNFVAVFNPQLAWHLPQAPEPPSHGIDLGKKQPRQSSSCFDFTPWIRDQSWFTSATGYYTSFITGTPWHHITVSSGVNKSQYWPVGIAYVFVLVFTRARQPLFRACGREFLSAIVAPVL